MPNNEKAEIPKELPDALKAEAKEVAESAGFELTEGD